MLKVGDVVVVIEQGSFCNKMGIVCEIDDTNIPISVNLTALDCENPVWFEEKERNKESL